MKKLQSFNITFGFMQKHVQRQTNNQTNTQTNTYTHSNKYIQVVGKKKKKRKEKKYNKIETIDNRIDLNEIKNLINFIKVCNQSKS